MRHRRPRCRYERGATLIELLIAALMSIIIAGAAMEFYVNQHKSWLMQMEVSEVQQNARVCLDAIAGSLRMAGYRLTTHPAFVLGTDSITVFFRREPTTEVDTTVYFVSTDDPAHPALMRQLRGEAPEVFAEDVEALTVSAISPRVLQLSIVARAARPDPGIIDGDGYRRRVYTTEVQLRNL